MSYFPSPREDDPLFYHPAHPTSAFLHRALIPNPQALPPKGSIFSNFPPSYGWVMASGFPRRAKDHNSSIFSGFAGLLAILLVVAVFCILWNWSKWKKCESLVCPKLRHTRINQLAWYLKPSLPSRDKLLSWAVLCSYLTHGSSSPLGS